MNNFSNGVLRPVINKSVFVFYVAKAAASAYATHDIREWERKKEDTIDFRK